MFAPAFCVVWVVKQQWDVGRPAPKPPRRLAAMRSHAVCRCRGRRPRRPAEVNRGGRYAGGMNFSPTGYLLAGVRPEGCGGVKTPPYDAQDKGVVMARWRAGQARPLRTVTKWDVGRPARLPRRFTGVRNFAGYAAVGGGVPDAPQRGQAPPCKSTAKGVQP